MSNAMVPLSLYCARRFGLPARMEETLRRPAYFLSLGSPVHLALSTPEDDLLAFLVPDTQTKNEEVVYSALILRYSLSFLFLRFICSMLCI